jgi:oxygen-dependent protoporphyrinogen oxidase
MTSRRVLVVGGGITGLAAAARLVDANTKDDAVDVELWEASDRLGGKIATSPFGGLDHVDEGADAYLTRVPHAVAFARKVGLGSGDLTSPTDATAMVWYDELHPIPGGIVLGVPASVRPFVTTSLLSWRGKLRAAAEPFLPRTDPDDSIGALVRARFGFEVHDRLVDALVGSIYATDTDRASLAAVPQLAELAKHNRSLLIGGRAARRRACTGRSRRALRRGERWAYSHRLSGAHAGSGRRGLGRRWRALRRRCAGDTRACGRRSGEDGRARGRGRTRLLRARRRDVGARAVRCWRDPDRRLRRAQRLPRAQVTAAFRDRRVVRF